MRERSQKSSSAQAGEAVAIELPRLSADEGSATLARWLVAVGDAVEKGAIIAELETDKATVELEAPAPGRIESILIAAGSEGLKPGALLGRIQPPASATPPPPPAPRPTAAPPRPASAPDPAPTSAPTSAPMPASPPEAAVRSPATPLARRLAESHGVDLGRLTGTGIGGRIEKADVERSLEPVTEVAPAVVAVADAQAIQSSAAPQPAGGARPAVHLEVRCAAEGLLAARARFEQAGEARGAKITINDFVVRAAALGLRDVPASNLRRRGEGVEAGGAADVALVVATESGSQLAVLRDADRKGLAVLSEEIRSRVEGARAGEVVADAGPAPSLLVTSFARFGIESAFPMVPSELVVVLAVGALLDEAVVRDGKVEAVPRMALTLAYDPNVVGGAVMAQLLAAIRGHLEDPMGMVL